MLISNASLLLSLSFLLLSTMSYGMEYLFGCFGSAVLSVPLTNPCPALLAFVGGVGETALLLLEHCSVYPKHWCVTNILLATKHSSMKATMEKNKSTTVRANIKIYFFVHTKFCNNHHPLRQQSRQSKRKIVSIS